VSGRGLRDAEAGVYHNTVALADSRSSLIDPAAQMDPTAQR
jgi:hypothetical protein